MPKFEVGDWVYWSDTPDDLFKIVYFEQRLKEYTICSLSSDSVYNLGILYTDPLGIKFKHQNIVRLLYG